MTDETSAFPQGGRRVIFYLVYDPQGIIDDYIPYKLERLRPFADHIFVVVNGALTDEGRTALEGVADTVWQRENVGFDVWGYKSALAEFGAERLAEFDELILMNYTWFGPVGSFGPVFERMDAEQVDFWGMTDHAGITPNPYTETGTMHAHIQSHWIAVRRSMFQSPEWAAYWSEMPMITSYVDSILSHESKFTDHFATLGFSYELAFPKEDYPSDHPAFVSAQSLIEDGCPVLKRRPFFHSPLYLDREAIIGRWLLDAAAEHGYPIDLVLQNMARNAQPKVLNTNAAMLEILPETAQNYDASKPFRIAAAVHVFYEDMTDELLDRLAYLPSTYDLYATTTTEQKAETIRGIIAGRNDERLGRVDVRVLPSNRGRDLSAFYIGTRDVLISDEYDLVVKIHSKKTVQQGPNAGNFFKRQQFDNLLNSPGYAANALALFQQEPGLGLVFPPTIHIGYPTLGHAWFANLEPTRVLSKKLGIHVPLDDASPLAPLGAMFIARPEALRLLTDVEWSYDEYAPETDHRDGSLAHVQERIVAYAAGQLGFHSRTVANAEYAAISHTLLEYKLDQMSSVVSGYPIDQVHSLQNNAGAGASDPVGYLKMYVNQRHPRSARVLVHVYAAMRTVYRTAGRSARAVKKGVGR
ncbi:rhamnan synthesis F family protein [Agromyces sp. PvR057]|uniref:rhamnan synthesis F family protein n=1 Tax=Agromyces sp. PvR057 TaxID=3156403 RepID=UPI000E2300A2